MDLEFSGEVWFWRGPSPFHFVTVPEDESAELEAASAAVTYGWGMIPVEAVVAACTDDGPRVVSRVNPNKRLPIACMT